MILIQFINMKKFIRTKTLILLSVFSLFAVKTNAQIKDISYTFSPIVGFVFSDKSTGIGDGIIAGGQFGFSFGEYVQLNANYIRTIGASTDFSSLLNGVSTVADKDVLQSRIGGELKANLSRKAVVPYIALGTGFQSVTTSNTEKSKQIYLSSGLGVTYRLDDRINLGLGLYNTSYRMNAYYTLMNDDERALLNKSNIPNTTAIITDLSVRASASFFLGGKRPGNLSELDMAYIEQFSNGFKGLSIPIEPTFQHVNFSEKLPLNDAYFGGLSTGLDFGRYVGIRLFYLQAMEEGSITTFGKLAIWGGETKFKLNSAEGVVPFITLGGGRIEVFDGYIPPVGTMAENKIFASGGLGIEIPLSRNIKLIGFANGLFTTVGDINDLTKPEDLVSSTSFGAKLGFFIGRKPESAQVLLEKNMSYRNNEYEMLLREKDSLIQQNNMNLAQKQTVIDSLNNTAKKVNNYVPVKSTTESNNASIIRVTPQELIQIIREIKAPAPTYPALPAQPGQAKRDSVSDIKTIKNIQPNNSAVESTNELVMPKQGNVQDSVFFDPAGINTIIEGDSIKKVDVIKKED